MDEYFLRPLARFAIMTNVSYTIWKGKHCSLILCRAYDGTESD